MIRFEKMSTHFIVKNSIICTIFNTVLSVAFFLSFQSKYVILENQILELFFMQELKAIRHWEVFSDPHGKNLIIS